MRWCNSRWAGSHISATDVSQIVLEPLKSLSARTMCQIILCGGSLRYDFNGCRSAEGQVDVRDDRYNS